MREPFIFTHNNTTETIIIIIIQGVKGFSAEMFLDVCVEKENHREVEKCLLEFCAFWAF